MIRKMLKTLKVTHKISTQVLKKLFSTLKLAKQNAFDITIYSYVMKAG